MSPTVLISGASIAGPALAYWLHRYGFRPVVVERAADVRGGGYPVDIRGPAVDAVDRMGVLPQLRAAHIDTRRMTFVDGSGRTVARITPDDITGSPEGQDIEVPRGDLARVLYKSTRDDVEYVFGDSISSMEQAADGVRVTFRSGRERTVDLVVGADGLHSNVRALAFGPEEDYRHDLGFYFAGFTMDDDRGLAHEALLYNTPGRAAAYYAVAGQPRSTALLAFASRSPIPFDRTDVDQQREVVAEAFAGAGWDVPRMVAAMRAADDVFLDTVSQIRMPRWSTGRVALVGDAAHAPSFLAGQGTSLALVGAYVLAGELAAAAGDHRVAFPAYERTLRGFVERNQGLARPDGGTVIPTTRARLWMRNRILQVLPLVAPVLRHVTGRVGQAARSFELPRYSTAQEATNRATAAG
jgi:2-polyprenyl-6-methoxyphenol hydroxylase-like FAD-dependent oxidoreductase